MTLSYDNHTLKDAVADRYITTNPAKETKKYNRPKPKIKVLNQRELKQLLTIAKGSTWYLEILLGLFCGLRRGEILGLKLSDFDLEDETVTINRQLVADMVMEKKSSKIKQYELVECDSKTINSFRTLRVPKVVLTELERRTEIITVNKILRNEEYIDKDYISCQQDGKPHALTSLNQFLIKSCRRLNLPIITPHGLRHMFATILIEQSVSLAKISALLGHNSIHTTFEYYCEIMDSKEQILAFTNDIFAVEGE